MAGFGNAVSSFFSRMKNMTAVESGGASKDLVRTRELISNLKKKVVTEERWELPSETQDHGAADQTAERKGVVVTLEDGQTRYLVSRMPNEQKDDVDVIVTYASHMGPDWVRVEEKQVQNMKLEDYLDQGEDKKFETEANFQGVSEEKNELKCVNLVQVEDRGDSTESHSSQLEDEKDSPDGRKDSEDVPCKI